MAMHYELTAKQVGDDWRGVMTIKQGRKIFVRNTSKVRRLTASDAILDAQRMLNDLYEENGLARPFDAA